MARTKKAVAYKLVTDHKQGSIAGALGIKEARAVALDKLAIKAADNDKVSAGMAMLTSEAKSLEELAYMQFHHGSMRAKRNIKVEGKHVMHMVETIFGQPKTPWTKMAIDALMLIGLSLWVVYTVLLVAGLLSK